MKEYFHVSEWNDTRDKICNTDKAMTCLNEIMCSAPCQVVHHVYIVVVLYLMTKSIISGIIHIIDMMNIVNVAMRIIK